MSLNSSGKTLSGSYFYEKIGSDIQLTGNIDDKGEFTLIEKDQTGKQTGTFKGKFSISEEMKTLVGDGTWSKPNDKKGLKFSLYPVDIELTSPTKLILKEIKEEKRKPRYTIEVEYPQLTGHSNPSIIKFNQLIEKQILDDIKQFGIDMKEYGDDAPPTSMGSDITIGYDVALATDRLVSICVIISTYYAGAAHPNHFSRTVNYDLDKGKEIKLADLFKPGTKYLEAIASYCISELKREADDSSLHEWIDKGAEAADDNYKSWTIERKGIRVYFDPYQVASYAEGRKEVLIPYEALKDIMRPNSF
jgi:hypothetical protein